MRAALGGAAFPDMAATVLREALVDKCTELKLTFDEVGDPMPDGRSRRSSPGATPASGSSTGGPGPSRRRLDG